MTTELSQQGPVRKVTVTMLSLILLFFTSETANTFRYNKMW